MTFQLMNLLDEVDSLFQERPFFYGATERTFQPSCEVEETQDNFLVSLDLPGVSKEDLQVEVREGLLLISGERKPETRANLSQYRRSEKFYGKFQRTFQLPKLVDTDRIEANFEDGVLQIAVPKAEAARPKTIKIESGKGGFFSKLLGGEEKVKEVEHAH